MWRYPDTERRPLSIETCHQANIFGVQFLHVCGDSKLVTGAMDHTVQLHEIDCCPADIHPAVRHRTSMRRHPDSTVQGIPVRTKIFHCHHGRVEVCHFMFGHACSSSRSDDASV